MIQWNETTAASVDGMARIKTIAKLAHELAQMPEPPDEDSPYVATSMCGDSLIRVERCYGSDKLWVKDCTVVRAGTIPLAAFVSPVSPPPGGPTG